MNIVKKRKKKSKIYFGKEVQNSIINYINEQNDRKKSVIYEKEIHKAFDKLVENIINTFKFSYFDDYYEDVKSEVISFMVINIYRYDYEKGRAFSYFGTMAKNYLIQLNNGNFKRYKVTTFDLEEHDRERNFDLENSEEQGKNINKEFIEELVKYLNNNYKKIFKTEIDIKICLAIVEVLKRKNTIEVFNKKSIYLYIREISGCKTQQISRVVNILKKKYPKLNKIFLKDNYLEDNIENEGLLEIYYL